MHGQLGRRGILASAGSIFASCLTGPASAQRGVIRLVVPWSPGGQTDVIARLFAEIWARQLSQNVIVENRSGASGTIGHAAVAAAPADGSTVLLATNSTYAIVPHLMQNLPYQHETAFAPVALVATAPMMLWVSRRMTVQTLPELLDYGRARPGELNMGIGGVGSTSHLASELFMAQSGLRLTQVGYRGAGDTVRGLATSEIDLAFLGATTVKAMADAGGPRALGATGRRRSQVMPEVPTMAEGGLPDFEASTAFALFVPKATSNATITHLSETARATLSDATLRARMAQEDIEVLAGGPDELAAHVREESTKWGNIIRSRNITLG